MSEFSNRTLSFTFQNVPDDEWDEIKEKLTSFVKKEYNDFEIREKTDLILGYR